ncbi:polymorphic toxin type 44 domain-containing protein [Sulfurospirillum sp.]|uniref:polymorphic toxin type 44 domain-containing protein n=1 Tax=Sulfurospirillum sp. TaxID=2053622 RepID=UPI002FDE9E10
MSNEKFGFTGKIPDGVSIEGNIAYALEYQQTHSTSETLLWFQSMVQNKGDWDYKQLDQDPHPGASEYENFGNYHYGLIGTALGMTEELLRSCAGAAQQVSNTKKTEEPISFLEAIVKDTLKGIMTGVYGSYDAPNDQIQIGLGIESAKENLDMLRDTIGFVDGMEAYYKGKIPLPAKFNVDHTSTKPYDFNLTNSYFFQRRDPLALDTNKDGQVGGISEVFGNVTTEGFDELRDTIDSNYDNKIDRKDILFNRLQLWHDYDQDGSVDEGELKSLKEEGITSIDLNSVQTNINTNGNVITEASHYTTATGEKELIADVHLQYDARDTIIDLVQQEDFTIDPTTLNLPNLRGYGLVVDSFIAYQTNENLATLAKQYATDEQLISNDFDEYINEWSGYNAYKETIAKKYNLSADVDMSDLDRKIWIMEKFSGKEELTSRIESNYEANAKAVTGTKDVTVTSINGQNRLILASDYINTQYNSMLHRTQSEFAIQSVFEDVFTGVSYSVDTDALSVTDASKLQQSLTNYLFTCKTFSIQKALHVKIQNTVKGANDGAKNKVA